MNARAPNRFPPHENASGPHGMAPEQSTSPGPVMTGLGFAAAA